MNELNERRGVVSSRPLPSAYSQSARAYHSSAEHSVSVYVKFTDFGSYVYTKFAHFVCFRLINFQCIGKHSKHGCLCLLAHRKFFFSDFTYRSNDSDSVFSRKCERKLSVEESFNFCNRVPAYPRAPPPPRRSENPGYADDCGGVVRVPVPGARVGVIVWRVCAWYIH